MQGTREQVLLVRYAEIHLKGQNRPFFERKLVQAIGGALKGLHARVERAQSRVFVYGLAEEDMPEAIRRMKHVFGVHSVSPAVAVEKSFDAIAEAAAGMMAEALAGQPNATFKVHARRADKNFPMRSDEINRALGGLLLERFPALKVDVHTPDILVGVEVREKSYVYVREIRCAGGMPVGCNGRAALLISGGIDSPVAGHMIAKRGVSLSAVHFFSYPYTSERARDKVIELTRILSRYAGEIRLHLVPFTEIQLAIYEKCPSSQTTVLMRRLMMRIAEQIAAEDGAQALVTGEAIGQVASQTLESLAVTNDAVSLPVFRPLIGFDKQEIVERAIAIGTYETSILPYEDCCTVFVPVHPITRPRVDKLRESEALVDFTDMIAEAMAKKELLLIEEEIARLP
ncbi:MAG TPA: tRNA uracil 4-sulfurtransferase ThiI [Feifaniaceae bacterium]|nr:tRNA uracil 4-sulfurtransferase ThiI [Feifaniaceae bacterium]